MAKVRVEIQRMEKARDLPLPGYMTGGASGMDVYAAVSEKTLIASGDIVTIPAGIKMALPPGYEVQIRPRSGLAARHGITVINTPGTIDSDYRGEVKVALINLGKENHYINRGDRIAQMVVQEIPAVELREVDSVDVTERNEGGFGHTGHQ